jgi:hypothetical protein
MEEEDGKKNVKSVFQAKGSGQVVDETGRSGAIEWAKARSNERKK